jgi:hypothetical protein
MVMPVDQKIRNALKLSKPKAKLPQNPRVVDIQAEDNVDTDGEDALRVMVILDESVDIDNFRGEEIGALKSAIRNAVREHCVEMWPYIRFAKQSELDAAPAVPLAWLPQRANWQANRGHTGNQHDRFTGVEAANR